MNFGMTNAPFTFATLMKKAFKDLVGKCVMIYLDTTIVFNMTYKEHKKHLQQTLNTLKKHQLVTKLSKCEFYKSELLFLGHTITAFRMKSNPAKVEVITKMPPKDAGKVFTFLEMVVYVRKFISGYGGIIAPLPKSLIKSGPFTGTPHGMWPSKTSKRPSSQLPSYSY